MNQPLDIKLLLLRLFSKWYVILICTVLLAAGVGGLYYCVKTSTPDRYEMGYIMHIEYAEDSAGNTIDYINEYTWQQWGKTDMVANACLAGLGPGVTGEQVKSALGISLETDVRVVFIKVTSEDEGLCRSICEASKVLPEVFTNKLAEISDAFIVDEDDAPHIADRNLRTINAVVLGAVGGFLIGLFAVLIRLIMDDSVYIPLLFSSIYGIKMKPDYDEYVPEGEALYVGRHIILCDEQGDNGVYLVVESGAHNGKLLLATINELEENGVPINGAVLKNANKRLIKAYYAATAFPNPFIR